MPDTDQDVLSRRIHTIGELMAHGGFDKDLEMAIRSPGGVDRAIKAMRHEFCLEDDRTPSQQMARKIMGSNMLGIPEVWRHFIALTDAQQEALAIVPFTEATLRACAETHILVADIGLSISHLVHLGRKYDRSTGEASAWSRETEFFRGNQFVLQEDVPCWRLIRNHRIESSRNKTWRSQKDIVDSAVEEIPSSRQMFYLIILYHLVTGEKVYKNTYMQTSDNDRPVKGSIYGVGGHYDGIVPCYSSIYLPDQHSNYCYITSARKPDLT